MFWLETSGVGLGVLLNYMYEELSLAVLYFVVAIFVIGYAGLGGLLEMLVSPKEANCQRCRRHNKSDARVCRHCGRDMPPW